MLLGCNYSPQLTELIQENRVQVDYIKLGLYEMFREGFEISRALGPVLLHGVAVTVFERAGMKSVDGIDWAYINDSIRLFKSPHVGFHLEAKVEDWDGVRVDDDTVIQRAIETTKIWARNIAVPLLVENVPYSNYYGNKGVFECLTRPEVIRQVCQETGAGLLLDLSHARITAWYREEEFTTYLTRLPLERVEEIHVVGSLMTSEGPRDKHVEMAEDDYVTLEWLLERTQPHVVTLEYGGVGPQFEGRSEKETLERQLLRLREICRRY